IFDAAANGPAVLVVAVEREGDGNAGKGQRLAIVGIGVAALDVEQRRTGSVADAAGDGAEAALVVAVDVTGGEDGAEVVLAEPAILSFDTDDPARRELPVGAGLHAAEQARVVIAQHETVEIVAGAEGAAEMAADIEAGPVVDRRGKHRRLGIAARAEIGAKRGRNKGGKGNGGEQDFFHLRSPTDRLENA